VNIPVLALLVAFLAMLAAWLNVPEFREWVGLETKKTESPRSSITENGKPKLEQSSPEGQTPITAPAEPSRPDRGSPFQGVPSETTEIAKNPEKSSPSSEGLESVSINRSSQVTRTDTDHWRDSFMQALNDIAIRSNWHCAPGLSSFLKEGPIEVLFTKPRLQAAAEIVYRLRSTGANVTFRLVSVEDTTVKHSGLFYHWNRLKMAQAIQAVVQDIELLEIKRTDQPGSTTLWIT
jgi:hypothetical protein